MYLNEIYKETIYGVRDSYSEKDFNFPDDVSLSGPLKISIYETGTLTELPPSSIISVDSSTYSSKLSGYPENAFTVELKKGEYVIAYEEGGLISRTTGKVNDCIKVAASSTSQKLDFDEFALDSEILSSLTMDSTDENGVYFIKALKDADYECHSVNTIKINGKTKLHAWINDPDVIGILRLKIYKINTGRYQEKVVKSLIKIRTDNFTIDLPKSMIYEAVVSEIKEDRSRVPQFKYPVGTYQIVTYEKLGSFNVEAQEQNIISDDLRRFNRVDGKLQSLDNIEIPHDVDPLNHYIMLGKVELMLYIDFNNDEYYLRPSSYAEVFMNLFVPQTEITLVEESDDYAIYNIIDYIIVEYDFRDKDRIISSIKNWIRCTDDDIHTDEFDIYYYITNFDLYDWYYIRFRNAIERHFIYVKLDPVVARAYDNVEILRNKHDSELDFTITECNWEIVQNPNAIHYNVIDWNYTDNWVNTDVTNEIRIDVPGSGIIKVSRKHFKNVSGIDIDNVNHDVLTDSQFRELKLNYPIINPYSRLQYWLGIKL